MVNRLARFFKDRKKLGFTAGSILLATLLALNLGSASIGLVTVEAGGVEFRIPQIVVKGEQYLSVQTGTTLIANVGDSKIEHVEPTFSKGMVPISGIYYDDGIRVNFTYLPDEEDYKITEDQMFAYLETHSLVELESKIEADLQPYIEDTYVAVHFYSSEPLKYTTRFSVNPIEGEWWN